MIIYHSHHIEFTRAEITARTKNNLLLRRAFLSSCVIAANVKDKY